jgi:hypothetical protein
LLTCLALLLLAATGLLGPRLMDGFAALEWARYHAGRVASARHPVDEAGRLGRWAARAVDRLAPLPGAREAAELALGVARGAQDDPRLRRAALTPLAATLDAVRRSWLRGLGLAEAYEEAQRLEQHAQGGAP